MSSNQPFNDPEPKGVIVPKQNEELWNELYRHIRRVISSIVRRKFPTMRNEAIDEAIDETILAVYQHFDFERFRGKPREEWMGALHKYLAKTTVTTVVRAFHKESHNIRSLASPVVRRINRTVTPEELHDALAQLSKQDRILLDAFIVDGRSYSDIADQFTQDFGEHFNEDQLKTRKLRAIAVLRRALLKGR